MSSSEFHRVFIFCDKDENDNIVDVHNQEVFPVSFVFQLPTLIKALTDNGKLKRFDNGIYYIPKKSKLGGEVSIPPDVVVEKKYVFRNNKILGYYSGCTFANQIGISTQVPYIQEIVTNEMGNPIKKLDLGGRIFVLRKSRTEVTEDNVKVLQFLDLLKDIEMYAELKGEEMKECLSNYINNNKITKEIVDMYLCPTACINGVHNTVEVDLTEATNNPIDTDLPVNGKGANQGKLCGYPVVNQKMFTYPFNFLRVVNGEGQKKDYAYEYFFINHVGHSPEFEIEGSFFGEPSVSLFPKMYKRQTTARVNNENPSATAITNQINYDDLFDYLIITLKEKIYQTIVADNHTMKILSKSRGLGNIQGLFISK